MEKEVLIFKPHNQLPAAFKHLTDYIPAGLSNVLVVGQEQKGSEVYLTVRFGKQKAVLNRTHFWTLGQKLIYLKRRKLKTA